MKGKEPRPHKLWASKMIDPATRYIEIKDIKTKSSAVEVSNILEKNWLSRYPRPSVMGQGKESMTETTK